MAFNKADKVPKRKPVQTEIESRIQCDQSCAGHQGARVHDNPAEAGAGPDLGDDRIVIFRIFEENSKFYPIWFPPPPQRGYWRDKQFKQYNFDAMGAPPASGHLHPLLKVRAEFRDIFFQMGFTVSKKN